MSSFTVHSRSAMKAALLGGCLLSILGASSTAMADDSGSMQFLPPTTYGKADLCDQNQILVYTGVSARDSSNRQISAINCLTTGLSVNPTTGDVWLGSTNPGGDSWTKGAAEHGPALHMSSATGMNSDDIYFQRFNNAQDLSELRLVVGDNASDGAADTFIIGALDSANGYTWIPRFTFKANGNLGLGTTTPLATLHVVSPSYNNNMTGILVESTNTNLGSPRIGFVDTALGTNTTAPAWYVDNLADRFRIFRQPTAFTSGAEALSITHDINVNTKADEFSVGIGTPAPDSALDVVAQTHTDLSVQTGAIHTYTGFVGNQTATGEDNYGGNIWIGGNSDMRFDGGTDSYFWFNNSGAIQGATAFLWDGDATHAGRFNLYIQNTGNVGVGTGTPKGTLDVENDTNTATLCLNGDCASRMAGEYMVSFTKLNQLHPQCLADRGNAGSWSAVTNASCASACDWWCQGQAYVGGTITQWNGDNNYAVCLCMGGQNHFADGIYK